MLTHTRSPGLLPPRTVVVGAAGFVGHAVANRIAARGGDVVGLARAQIDLGADTATDRLVGQLRPKDTVIISAVKVPCRTPDMVVHNLAMMARITNALRARPVDHVVYVSSDAVYADSSVPLTESSLKGPDNLYGIMQLTRELMLRDVVPTAGLTFVRPTMIYGAADPHGGYGPNQYRRLAAASKDIILFGEGEERRDHVFIDDVAEIIARIVEQRSVGALNVASGAVHSFRAIAEQIAELYGNKVKVIGTKRSGPMPHGGYRPFDISAIGLAFPDLKMTQLPDGIARVHREIAER
ncbi:MAG: NAD-dependent epimerase/dehydratase family protein [Alphaproteobacteria bacterium]|nr:NAD-dependent epimerase/dehydratase family protein [Alphaproteobacteria bacterium]